MHIPLQPLPQELLHSPILILGQILPTRDEALPLIARQQNSAHGDLGLEAQLIGAGQEGVGAEEADVLELFFGAGGDERQDDVVETNVVVGDGGWGGWAGERVGADETVVHEEFVVGVGAVGGEDFFARGFSPENGRC